ncbi:universal stress protein UspA [Halodesulfurarchaeum formicicum]|uniref:Universal stress protein UspA n=1 Tax=Halodesulfurarchaeum formicicum TaxID=1873524 RepID=A0A1D8S1K6_9EURY|nr:universal stress protein [Halodesulfurarchaeum formicicum]AOW79237.1 universal stress protein UspA [Halodesulfurarchaeum formicicum]
MVGRGSDGDVMVAVEDPAQVAQLVRTARDIAQGYGGTVRLVTVVVKPYESPFGMFSDETIVQEFAADSHELLDRAPDPEGVEVVRDLVVARSVEKGLVSAVKRTNPAALVIGWDSDPRRSDALLGTTVDHVLEHAPTDVYVERIGREAGAVESVLLPVAGGPHTPTARTAAVAIARENGAAITVLTVATENTPEREARAVIDQEAATIRDQHPDLTVETQIERGTVKDVIVAESGSHDVLVLGATRKGPLRGRLVGSVPRRIVDGTEQTVIIARSASVAGGLFSRVAAALTGGGR